MTVQVALRTVSLESRRSGELARLLERHGLRAIAAPSLREVPIEDQREAFAFGQALVSGECDALVLLTGVGLRALIDALATRWSQDEIVAALGRITIACRGPKPVAVLKELGLRPSVLAPEPNTWRELISALQDVDLRDKKVWVQEYGRSNPELIAALRESGAVVRTAAVYAWQLPLDTVPLERAIDAMCAGEVDAIAFTSARQIDHLLEIALRKGVRDDLMQALKQRIVIASIGPVTSEALAEHGIVADVVPIHPKMGHLVKALVEHGVAALERKRTL